MALLALCTLALLAGLIAVGVKQKDNDSGGNVSALPTSSNALLSTSNVTPAGFVSKGVLDASSGTWVLKAPFPGAAAKGVSDGSAVTAGNKVYYIGGHLGGTTGNNVTRLVSVFDPLSDSFTPGPPLPQPVARGAAVFDGKKTVYYAAGVTRVAGAPSEIFGNKQTPCLYSLDTTATGGAARWSELPCMTAPRSDFCAGWVGGKMYVVGGLDPEFAPMDSIESFDPITKKWTTEKYILPTGRLDLACAVIGDSLYAVGGIDTPTWDAPKKTWFSDSNARINPAKGTVEMLAPLPKARGDLTVAPFANGTLLAVGGETTDLTGTRTMIGTHEVFLYDAAYDIWVRGLQECNSSMLRGFRSVCAHCCIPLRCHSSK